MKDGRKMGGTHGSSLEGSRSMAESTASTKAPRCSVPGILGLTRIANVAGTG